MKRVVLVGGTGTIGRALVPHLVRAGLEVAIITRSVATSDPGPAGARILDYGALAEMACTADMVVHLAVLNNDQTFDYEEFERVNVREMLSCAEVVLSARPAPPRFVLLSSFHTLDPNLSTPYAQSKRLAESRLSAVHGENGLVIRIPALASATSRGKIGIVGKLPAMLRRPALSVLGALIPVVTPSVLAAFLVDKASTWPDRSTDLTSDQDANHLFSFAKRALDIAFALTIVIFFGWLLALIWLAVRIDSPGPGIFAQTRVGRNCEPFVCYKFRTMTVGAPQLGTHEMSPSAVTRIGRWLRKSKLDELPQVLNLLRNEISLVGPRPCLPNQTHLIEERERRGVMRVKPGITGLAQVNGIDMSTPTLLAQWDRRYIMTRTLPGELRIFLATVMGRGLGDRIVQSAK